VNTKWAIDPSELTSLLEERGFDIEASETSLPEDGGSLIARKEVGSQAVLVRTDAGGRVQILVTEQRSDDAAEPLEVSGLRLTITDSTIRHRTIRGTVKTIDQFRSILETFARIEELPETPPV
jgi:hypothetical protein